MYYLPNYNYWKKLNITYTNRIYKIFMKKKFSKMMFNFAHPTVLYRKNVTWNFINFPYDKTLITWYKCPKFLFNKTLHNIINVRPINYYTWRGLQRSDTSWTKKIGKISEYANVY